MDIEEIFFSLTENITSLIFFLKALGLMLVFYVLFQIINIFFSRKKNKELQEINKNVKEINKKLGKLKKR